MSRKRKSYIALMRGVMYVCSGLTAALLLFLLGYVLYKGIPNISWEFLSTKPSHLTERIGILPDIQRSPGPPCRPVRRPPHPRRAILLYIR